MRGAVLFALVAASCGRAPPPSIDLGAEDLAQPPPDIAAEDMTRLPCAPSNPCPIGQRCFAGTCIRDEGACAIDEQCEDDTTCSCASSTGDGGACADWVCAPWGQVPAPSFDPACGNTFPVAQVIAPIAKCALPLGGEGLFTTAVVGDLDGDGTPEIIFPTAAPSAITAIHGADCSVLFTAPVLLADPTSLALGDLDADGWPEIAGVDSMGHVLVFDHDGNRLAAAPGVAPTSMGSFFVDGEPLIADVDGVPPAEIVFAGQVLRYHSGNAQLEVVWQQPVQDDARVEAGPSIVADLDGDGVLEVIAGAQIFDGATGSDKTPAALKNLPGVAANAALADFDGDGLPDLALTQNSPAGQNQVTIYSPALDQFLMGPEVGTNVGSGPPAIADFDGDGQPELATIQSNAIKVYDLDCLKMPPPPECDQATSIGIRWKKTIQDFSSWSTSLAAFDLNGDGRADAIYRDECWLRAYDGLDGRVLFAVPLTSGTAIELPTVADVDGDGHAEIIVSSDDIERGFIAPCQDDPDTGTKWVGPTKGLFVFQDPFRRWMPARPTWNQHAYHGTNVGDDLSIPIPEPPSWKASNSYRAQPSLFTPVKLPDFTAAPFQGVDPGSPDCTKAWTLRATLCNRGAVAAAAGVPGTFYASDPTAGPATPICTAHTVGALAPGQCEQVACDWASPPAQMADLWFRADDDGAKPSVLAECKAANDLARLPGATCAKTP